MSVYYYKGAQILAPLTITSNEPMFDADTVSLRKQRASQNVQRWEMSFSTVGEPDTQVDMFLGAIINFDNADTMIMPQLPSVSSKTTATTETPAVFTGGASGITSVTLESNAVAGLIPRGTFFKFSNHGKIYVTTNDASLDGADPVVSFHPELRTAVDSNHTMNIGSAAIISYYQDIDNQTGITFTDGVLSNAGTITVIEAL